MEQRDVAGYGGCAAALSGVVTALYVWGSSRRTRVHAGAGFEGQGRDLSALLTDLPFVLLAGILIPPAVWLLTLRLLPGLGAPPVRALLSAVCTAGVLVLSAWTLHNWANPPDPDHIPASAPQISTSSPPSPRIT
ncbi:hypothetical protein AB0M42_02155 [Streptomyces sp. NPDC051784]|uniref:hypothetical protein n=1 Tax=Streptomyces sp. NPDC051784 TaxID=3155805 RepID=UPI003446F713